MQTTSSPLKPKRLLTHGVPSALCLLPLIHSTGALAACDNTGPTNGTTATCSATITTPVLAVPGSTAVAININAGSSASFVNSSNLVGFRVDSASQIANNGTLALSGSSASGLNRGAALLGNNNGNTLTNTSQGSITSTGAYNDGMAANGSNNTLINNGSITTAGTYAYGMTAAWGQSNTGQVGNTLVNTGSVTTGGSNARAMSILGGNGSVTNSGALLTTGTASTAVYMQGNGDKLVNSGIIEARGSGADAVFSNTAGSGFTASIENRAGGQIISQQAAAVRTLNGATTVTNAGLLQSGAGTAVSMGTGANALILQTGSVINGVADGGGNAATKLVLQGTGTASNAFSRFAMLQMQGSDWTWSGSGTFNTATIQSGRFNLTGTLGGTTTVQTGATLAGTGVLTGSLLNQGIVHPGTGNANGQLTVNGNYTGSNGILQAESVLGSDASPASRLVVSGGTIGGTTTIRLSNLAGAGGITTTDGIPLVQAVNGATSSAGAFTLAGGSVSAGAYTYYLFKGGVSAGTADNWYLRSSVPAVQQVTPPPTPDNPAPQPQLIAPRVAEGTPPLPSVQPGADPVPLYRPEVPIYAEIPVAVRQLGIEQIGTFHERQGEQSLLSENGRLPAAWARVWGEHSKQSQQGEVNQTFDGTLTGLQIGQDLYADTSAAGHRNHYGLLLGYAHAKGDVSGFALGFQDQAVGTLAIDAYSLGGYWSHIGPSGWYTDTVLLGSALSVDPKSSRGIGNTTHGKAFAASLEGGYPLTLRPNLTFEPQAQLIWQRVAIDDLNDGISTVSFERQDGFLGRIGARLQGQFERANATWQPYLRVNLLRSFGGNDQATFAGSTAIPTTLTGTAGQFGAGLVGKLSPSSSVYATLTYTTNLDSTSRETIAGNIGARFAW
ncbi:autotransporter outer membrane beta-barrel domain-containing protein [Neisseriaceae bacterium JH1-16]|nr:autotransporter outer membrane beta-barrel domain-containing protein [Neisseriaceae bacterium JH1-16]